MTKTRLAASTNLTVRSISAYENGETVPSPSTVATLAGQLDFPLEFFEADDIDTPSTLGISFRALSTETKSPGKAKSKSSTLGISFRALSTMTAGQRDSALAAGSLAFLLSDWLDGKFDLPLPDLPDQRHQPPQAAAESLRASWGLGERPIRNMVHLLEAHGVRVFSLAEECREVDAFSLWRGPTPFVFLNTMKSAEHSRFDAAHELGHLVLHRHGGPSGRSAEHEANAFASAFLMPRGSVLAAAPRFPNLDLLIRLKRNWNVSVAALAHRLHDLDLLSDWHYRSLCISMGERGYRKEEPDGIPQEVSQILQKVFQALRDEGMTKIDVARALHIPPKELDSLMFGLVMVRLEGGRSSVSSSGSPPPKLRVV